MADQVQINIGANATKALAAFGLVAGAAQAMTSRIVSFGIQIASSIPAAIGKAIASADKMYASSKIAGVNVEEFSALAYAANQSEVSIADLEVAARYLAKTHKASLLPALLQTAEEFETIDDEVEKLRISTERFGKSGTGLMPLLSNGKKGLAGAVREANNIGVVINRDFAESADKLNDSWDKLTRSMAGFANEAAQVVIPVLQELVTALNNMTAAMIAFKAQSVSSLMSTAWDAVKAAATPSLSTPSLSGIAVSAAKGFGPMISNRLFGMMIGKALQGMIGSDPGAYFPPKSDKKMKFSMPESTASSAWTSRGFLNFGEVQLANRTLSYQKTVTAYLSELVSLQKQYLPDVANALS